MHYRDETTPRRRRGTQADQRGCQPKPHRRREAGRPRSGSRQQRRQRDTGRRSRIASRSPRRACQYSVKFRQDQRRAHRSRSFRRWSAAENTVADYAASRRPQVPPLTIGGDVAQQADATASPVNDRRRPQTRRLPRSRRNERRSRHAKARLIRSPSRPAASPATPSEDGHCRRRWRSHRFALQADLQECRWSAARELRPPAAPRQHARRPAADLHRGFLFIVKPQIRRRSRRVRRRACRSRRASPANTERRSASH